jgi:hypothetical protein
MPEKVKAFTVNFHYKSRLNIFEKMDLGIPFSLLSVSKIAKLIKSFGNTLPAPRLISKMGKCSEFQSFLQQT